MNLQNNLPADGEFWCAIPDLSEFRAKFQKCMNELEELIKCTTSGTASFMQKEEDYRSFRHLLLSLKPNQGSEERRPNVVFHCTNPIREMVLVYNHSGNRIYFQPSPEGFQLINNEKAAELEATVQAHFNSLGSAVRVAH